MTGERSPLLLASTDSVVNDERPTGGGASVKQTIFNIAKTCMGTGTLVLPFAARQGGLWLNVWGLFAIAAWNIYAIERLLQCLELLLPRQCCNNNNNKKPPEGTSTLSKVAFYALGPVGLNALDGMFVILLLGIIVAYLDAIISFLHDTPFTTGTAGMDSLLTAIIIGLLSNVPDMGFLSKTSAIGLTILFLTFIVIASYGTLDGHSLNYWPKQGAVAIGISHWFGCTVFGFGSVPLTYNLRDSMTEPQYMLVSSTVAMTAVAVAYIVIGEGILLLYPDIEGDVLQELPTSGILPTVVRLAMVVVVLVTAPLLVVPCGELIEGKLFSGVTVTTLTRVSVRVGICMLCTGISVGVPSFVYVLSFVGSCCVALVSFVVPPLLHIFLSLPIREHIAAMNGLPTAGHDHPPDTPIFADLTLAMAIDIGMLIWGVAATIFSSVYTFRVALSES